MTQSCPVGSDYIALPLVTVVAPASDTGLSLVLSPEEVLLDLKLSVTAAGRVQFTHSNHRFGTGKTVKFTMHLVPHEASWRGGLRFLTTHYPQYFSNMMTERLELCRELDGIYTELGNNGNALNAAALLCLRKPAICWTYDETLHQPDADSFMQRHLYMGCFPTAPYPYNNHCINPEPNADQLHLDYGPLLGVLRGKKWVLTPRCVECDTAKVNLFEIPGGYVLPVTFGGTAPAGTVHLRNFPRLNKLRCEVLHPGAETATRVASAFVGGVLEVTVPLKRGCAMVKLSR